MALFRMRQSGKAQFSAVFVVLAEESAESIRVSRFLNVWAKNLRQQKTASADLRRP